MHLAKSARSQTAARKAACSLACTGWAARAKLRDVSCGCDVTRAPKTWRATREHICKATAHAKQCLRHRVKYLGQTTHTKGAYSPKAQFKRICRSSARGLEAERCWKHDAAKRCNQTSKTHLKCERHHMPTFHTKPTVYQTSHMQHAISNWKNRMKTQ